ncbi:MAG: YfhO family protein [Chloroflexota bacterium]
MESDSGRQRARFLACRSHPDVLAALALLLLVVLFNPGLALFGQVLGGYDAFVYFSPLRSYIAETLGRGQLPLWNPYLFAGTPYLANPQTAVFYPGTWLFVPFGVPRAYALNFLAHLWIAGLGLYALARVSLGLGRVAGVLGGAAFAFSGFMNGQAGHINQFSVAALVPVVAVLLDTSLRTGRLLPMLGLVIVLTLQIVAGHPQQVYMTVVALGMLLLWRVLLRADVAHDWRASALRLLRRGLVLGVACGLAGGISAIQLLPTLELSGLSIRGGGLSYQLASFDALPWPLLLPSLFPGYWSHLPTTEFFGHTGTVLFTLAWLGLLAGAGRPALLGALYVTLGLLLAVGDATSLYRWLYDMVPGFASFRVPARWLMISTFGISILVAVGVDWLTRPREGGRAGLLALARQVGLTRGLFAGVIVPLGLASLVVLGQPQSRWLLLVWGLLVGATLLVAMAVILVPRIRPVGLVLLVLGGLTDLWVAGMNLEHRQTIPNVAYMQPREATAELLSRATAAPQFRSLSIASTEYVVKETGEYEQRYASMPRLSLDNLLFAVKWNETLWPNTPMEFRLASADGYDGGVLPLRTFATFTRAMLGERARPDGVLISRLDAMPASRWLDLLGVRWVLAGRVKDDTRGVVYYDRGVSRLLRPGERMVLDGLPLGHMTKLGMISSVAPSQSDGSDLSIGARVGTLRLDPGDGSWREIPLTVGAATAPERWAPERVPALERVEAWSQRGPDAPADWIAEVEFPSQPVARLEIVNTMTQATLQIRALNLIDDGRQMAFPITPDSSIERLDFFDVKLYDRQQALPRAYLVQQTQVLDDEAAAARLAEPTFDPRQEAILAPGEAAAPRVGGTSAAAGTVTFTANQPEQIRLAVDSPEDSMLVLSDSWFPGWRATVDGVDVPITRANILFRAVSVSAGAHTVEFRYEPRSIRIGAAVSGLSALLTATLFAGAAIWRRRGREGRPA